jgi:hypothetical protein
VNNMRDLYSSPALSDENVAQFSRVEKGKNKSLHAEGIYIETVQKPFDLE